MADIKIKRTNTAGDYTAETAVEITFISTAYSNGSSFDTLSAKPLTIMALASSSEMPRDIR